MDDSAAVSLPIERPQQQQQQEQQQKAILYEIVPYSTHIAPPELVSSTCLHDGLWQHDGWTLLPELMNMLQQYAELRRLLARLGKRATAEDLLERRTGGRPGSIIHYGLK
jgi:hypothetical protein